MNARLHAVSFVLAVSTSPFFTACERRGAAEGLHDALLSSNADTATFLSSAPDCPSDGHRAAKSCLDTVATWLGSTTGFRDDPPNQASAAAAATFVLRGHGATVPTPPAWLTTLREGRGVGSDALRLAVASRMQSGMAPLARALTTEADARALMKAVAASAPAACETYALLGSGVDDATLPPESRVDHSSCVQADLNSPSGPALHGRYGSGVWRGAEGALALWTELAGVLRAGVGVTDAKTHAALLPKLDAIDVALAKVQTTKIASPPDNSAFMTDSHGDAHGDAGAPVVPPPAPQHRPVAGKP